MSFTSTTIVPLAAAGAGGDSYYIGKYTYSGSVTGAGITSKVETIVDLQDGTIGIWSNSNVYQTTDTRAQNYSRVTLADGTLGVNKYINYDTDPSFRGATYSSYHGLQFLTGRWYNGSVPDGIAVFDKDGTRNSNSYYMLEDPQLSPFAIHEDTGRIYWGSGDRLYGMTYTNAGGFAYFYEGTFSQGGSFRHLAWQNDKLCGLVNKTSDGYVMKLNATGTGTSPSVSYMKQNPGGEGANNFNQKGAPQTIQADGTDFVFMGGGSNWTFWKYDSAGTGYKQYSMNRTVYLTNSNGTFTSYFDLIQVLVDQTRSDYVYSIGRFRWRPQWAIDKTSTYQRWDRGSVVILQHNFSDLSLNKAIALSVDTSLATTSDSLGTDTGNSDNRNMCGLLTNDDLDLVVSYYGNKGRYNNKSDQELFVVKIPTDFSAITMGVYNGWRFEDITSIITGNASPSTQSGTPYARSYTFSSATPPSAIHSSLNNMSSISLSTNLVDL